MAKNEMFKYYQAMGKIQSSVTKAANLYDALKGGISVILDTTESDIAVVWYIDEDKKILSPYYWIGNIDLTNDSHSVDNSLVGKVYSDNKSIQLVDYKNNKDNEIEEDFKGIDIKSFVCVPFSTKHEQLGCIEFINVKREYSQEDLDTCEILSLELALAVDEEDRLLETKKPGEVILSARDIKKDFKNGDGISHVLKGVNLDVYKGEFLAILGESGCGKSTFLNIIGGMDRATSGSIIYDGKELFNASQDELTRYRRDNIGFVFQSYNLMPNLNAKQNLDLIGELVENPLDSDDVLKMVGLYEKRTHYPSRLSGGQQQRISIARALVKNPKIIFADEPTAALDYQTSIEILQVLEKILKTGTTLIMVTHNEEITRMADRVVRMRNGYTYEITVNRHRAKATELVW